MQSYFCMTKFTMKTVDVFVLHICQNFFLLQILPYVNGTLYSLLSNGRFAVAAKDLGIEEKLLEVTKKLDGDGETRLLT
jgi:hypothetical protein